MSAGGMDLPSPSVEKRDTDKRIFVNRSLSLEKIKVIKFCCQYLDDRFNGPIESHNPRTLCITINIPRVFIRNGYSSVILQSIYDTLHS